LNVSVLTFLWSLAELKRRTYVAAS